MAYGRLRTFCAGGLIATLVGCGGGGGSEKIDSNANASCSGERQQSCSCQGGGRGAQQCSDGVWDECVCSTLDGGKRDAGGDARAAAPGAESKSLPCEVSAILEQHCSSCHGQETDFAAPMSLVSYDDLMARSIAHPEQKIYEQLPARLRSEASPMPPATRADLTLSEAQLTTLERWVEAGAKAKTDKGVCASTLAPDAGKPVPLDDPFADLKGPADCEDTYDFRAHADGSASEPFEVPAGVTLGGTTDRYVCFYFKPPFAADAQGLWFGSMLDQTKSLHHWLLYGTDAATHADGSVAPCSAAEPGAYLLAGWAPGAQDVEMPADVGLSMPTSATSGLILEVHYNNVGDSEILDRTGVRVCTTSKNKRKNTAAVHFTGSEGICIQPGQKDFQVVGQCNPRRDQGDIHIINVWPHMHKIGRRMQINIKRANGTTQVLHDAPFDFNSQRSFPQADVILKPGDTMETRCHYENMSTQAVSFGEKTTDEMCFGFVTAWPAGALAVDPTMLNPVQNIGLGIQPARRCLDPVGIFGSCNGLSDYPL